VTVDRITKRWVRNASDEKAVRNGCTFDEARGRLVCDWIEEYCVLYEGDFAGEPMRLMDWQHDLLMRLFGWVKWSDRWGRKIRRFSKGSFWMPKKNGKSPTIAAISLYLLCGDGEMGQKVFIGAKDGKQARDIAGAHAIEMVKRSPALTAECKWYENTKAIRHKPTSSVMEPLSSSNSRTQESKEGINGSVVIDETHVVDRAFIRRIRRAGISRSEPLQLEFSTAGNDPDCYGKDQFDYGKRVEAGEVENESFLYIAYAAPPDTADEAIVSDPVKFGRLANPSWGVTVGEEEFVADMQASRRTPQEWADFKMYRLNIWQVSSSPWLGASVWAGCRKDRFDEGNLIGRPCWDGFDFAQVRDMTAKVTVFRGDDDEEYLVVPRFWLPEATVENYADKAPLRQWVADGFLETTPGETTEPAIIRQAIVDDHLRFGVRKMAYDPWRTATITQEICEGVKDARGNVVVPGSGVERLEFRQNLQNYAEATQVFERLAIRGKIHHDGHPVLAWQVGHAVKTNPDNSGNYRIVKPDRNSFKSVDGVQAAIMGLALGLQDDTPAAVTCALSVE
jgi:phage terminase large subunit-like protein